MDNIVRRMLGDADPCVILPSLNLLHELIRDNGRDKYLDLVPSLVSILKQIIDHNLSNGYDYYKLSAPWLQIKMLQILSLLGQSNKAVSHEMYEVLR